MGISIRGMGTRGLHPSLNDLRLHVYTSVHRETCLPSYRFGATFLNRPANRWYPEAGCSRSTLTKQIWYSIMVLINGVFGWFPGHG